MIPFVGAGLLSCVADNYILAAIIWGIGLLLLCAPLIGRGLDKLDDAPLKPNP